MKPQLFVFDYAPEACAQSYTDEHLLLYIPILTEILRAVDAEKHPFKNNIIAKWCGNDAAHSWVNRLVAHMIKEVKFRFDTNTDHLYDDLHTLREHKTNAKPTRWLQLVPNKVEGNPIEAYRQFYCSTQKGATWTKRGAPYWFNSGEQTALLFN